MNNTDVLDSIIDSIKAEDFEGALEDTYHLEADGRRRVLKWLRQALRTCQKDRALMWANLCYGNL